MLFFSIMSKVVPGQFVYIFQLKHICDIIEKTKQIYDIANVS